ncbi:MAG: 50S ribosomal protein L6 [Gemmatimonadetes bacterium]|nr:50S ribosomal protein L6 [Gemmatimonadota bacterium]
MSRIGNAPITIPSGVDVKVDGRAVAVKGPRGELSARFSRYMVITVEDGVLSVARTSEAPRHRALHGLTRSLINNMILGVSRGFERGLELVGTGYRVEQRGDELAMQLGFSHPVIVRPQPGNQLTAEGQNRIVVRGIDKQVVGQQAAEIRRLRKPNPYTGKGIRYEGERVRRKAGKTAAGVGG